MKEQLYTIPLNDAVNANDECPFCFIERRIEQDLIDFVLGSSASYMEADIRDMTDRAGFCRSHFKKMFDYGNTLRGDALYAEQLPGGFIQVCPNTTGEDSKLNIEALFNAVHNNKELIKAIFNNE